GKSRRQGDIPHGRVPSQQQLPRVLDTTLYDVAMHRKSRSVAEEYLEVRHTESCDLRQAGQRQVASEIRLDVVAHAAKPPFRQLPSRGAQSCFRPTISPYQSRRDRGGQAVDE